jgi:hypothetical protein
MADLFFVAKTAHGAAAAEDSEARAVQRRKIG